MATTKNIVALQALPSQDLAPEVSPPAFALPEGVIYNAETGEHDYYHLGDYIGSARDHHVAEYWYHDYLERYYAHARRNPDNVIPVNGNSRVTEIVADWYACGDCGRCVDVGSVCECRQLTLTNDWYVIHSVGGKTSVSRSGKVVFEEVA